jgi:hypothetical protein
VNQEAEHADRPTTGVGSRRVPWILEEIVAGCDRIFIEHATGARDRATRSRQIIDHLRSGDTLVVGDSTAWRGRCGT